MPVLVGGGGANYNCVGKSRLRSFSISSPRTVGGRRKVPGIEISRSREKKTPG